MNLWDSMDIFLDLTETDADFHQDLRVLICSEIHAHSSISERDSQVAREYDSEMIPCLASD